MPVHSGEELKVPVKPVIDPPCPSPQGHEHPWRSLHKRWWKLGQRSLGFLQQAKVLFAFLSLTGGKHKWDMAVGSFAVGSLVFASG